MVEVLLRELAQPLADAGLAVEAEREAFDLVPPGVGPGEVRERELRAGDHRISRLRSIARAEWVNAPIDT